MTRRVDIAAILADPEQRRRLMVRSIQDVQAREGIDTTTQQAEQAYRKVRSETMNAYPPVMCAAMALGVTNPPDRSLLHGETHWKCVAMAGLHIGRTTPGFDPEFLLVFACLHDIMREDDDSDPDHGRRAAALWARLCIETGIERFPPYGPKAEAMHFALANHVGTPRSKHANPNVGLCWDADRVTLWRVGLRPDPQFLSTQAGRLPSASMFGLQLVRRQIDGLPFPAWPELSEEIQTWRYP